MIYLISGPPRCGKTTIAEKLSKKISVSWLSTDTLENIVMGYTSAADKEKRFPKSVLRQKTNYSNDKLYDQYSTNEIVRVYTMQSEASYEAIKRLIQSEIKENRSYILEGYHITPSLINELIRENGEENVRSIILTRKNAEDIVKGIKESTSPNDWAVEKTSSNTTYDKIAEMIIVYSKWFEAGAENYSLNIFNIDGDFHDKIDEAVIILSSK